MKQKNKFSEKWRKRNGGKEMAEIETGWMAGKKDYTEG